MRCARLATAAPTLPLILLAGVLACRSSGGPATRVASGTPPPAPPVPPERASRPEPAAEDGGLAAYAATYRREAESLARAQRLYLLRPQAPPAHFVDLRTRRPRPALGPVRARMFAFGFGYGCDGDRLVRPDGTLCPSAAYPGSTLTDAQTAQALQIARSAAASWDKRPRVQCFEPHHAIVLFDANEAPVAELTVCFECGTFLVTPGPDEAAAPTDGEATFFAETCRALRVGACPPPGTSRMPDLPPPAEAARTEPERRASQLRARLQPPEGVPTDRLLRDMPPVERQIICGWIDGAMGVALNGHYACDDGRSVWVDDADGCGRWPPSSCEATVNDVVACTRSRANSPCGVETPECISLDACRWGLLETKAAASKPHP